MRTRGRETRYGEASGSSLLSLGVLEAGGRWCNELWGKRQVRMTDKAVERGEVGPMEPQRLL